MEKCLSPVTFLQPLEKKFYIHVFLHLGRVVVLPFSIILAFSSLACMLQHISSFPFTKIFIVQHINSFHKFRSCSFSIQISVVLFHILSTINFWSRLGWGHDCTLIFSSAKTYFIFWKSFLVCWTSCENFNLMAIPFHKAFKLWSEYENEILESIKLKHFKKVLWFALAD